MQQGLIIETYLHVLTNNNTIRSLNEIENQKAWAGQHHREEMCAASNNGTCNILQRKREIYSA